MSHRDQWNRRYRYDDFLKDDRRQECIHGNAKGCPECEAEGEAIVAKERWEAFSVRAQWFLGGVMFMMFVVLLKDLWRLL